jgi:hypothetical protein
MKPEYPTEYDTDARVAARLRSDTDEEEDAEKKLAELEALTDTDQSESL